MSTNGENTKVHLDDMKRDFNLQYKYLKQNVTIESVQYKSNTEATEFRNAGNVEYKIRNDGAALELYTRSIASAMEGSKELALAYANRSAVLLRINKLAPCLHDINRALEEKYPENLRKKLRSRKRDCLIQVRKAMEEDEQLRLLKANASDPIVVKNAEEEAEWHNLCRFDNPLISNASSKIKIEYDETWGRFLAAKEDIEPGMLCRVYTELKTPLCSSYTI